MNDFLNSSDYFGFPSYQNIYEFEFEQHGLFAENNRDDNKNELNFQQPNPIIFNKKENEFFGDKLLEVDNNLELQILPNKDAFNKKIDQSKQNLINSTTKNTTKLLAHKTKRNNDVFGEEKETKLNKKSKKVKNIKNNINYIENNEFTKIGEKKNIQGRKKKEEKDKGNHTKNSEDNIMRKIKSNFMSFCHELINRSLKNKNWTFVRLKSNVNEYLKRDFNIQLLNKTFRELYEETPISSRYRSEKRDRKDDNKNLIHKIYEENVEIDTIKLLNLTYRELFSVFTREIKNMDPELEMKIEEISLLETNEFSNIYKFFEEIEENLKKDKEPEEDIKNYLESLKNLCMNYENWFSNKKGRNRSANKKMNQLI